MAGKSSGKTPKGHSRSAINGQYVSNKYAASHPRTTITHRKGK